MSEIIKRKRSASHCHGTPISERRISSENYTPNFKHIHKGMQAEERIKYNEILIKIKIIEKQTLNITPAKTFKLNKLLMLPVLLYVQ